MTATITSRIARREINPDFQAMCDRLKVLYMVEGPLSDNQAARILGWHPSTVSARRDGIRYPDGKRMLVNLGAKKDEVSGKLNIVWGYPTGMLAI